MASTFEITLDAPIDLIISTSGKREQQSMIIIIYCPDGKRPLKSILSSAHGRSGISIEFNGSGVLGLADA